MMKKMVCGLMIFGCIGNSVNGMKDMDEWMSKEPIERKIVPLMAWHEDELLPVPVAQRVVHNNTEGRIYFQQIEGLPRYLVEGVTKWYEYMLRDIMHSDHVSYFRSDNEVYITVGFLKASIDKMSSSEFESD